MLGSTVLPVRLGGIYGLASLTQERPDQYHVPIFQLLCTFVRQPPEDGKKDEAEQADGQESDNEHELRQDVQAARTAISRRSKDGGVGKGVGAERRTDTSADGAP